MDGDFQQRGSSNGKDRRNTDIIQRIAEDLLNIGVKQGGVLLVHASLRAMGHVKGGAETVILGLLEALGSKGTLLMPALSYEHVTPDSPVFDVRRTPSNVGAIPECFRGRFNTKRSIHPTHSVCSVGPLSDKLLQHHYLDSTPCGPNSPFRLLRCFGGQILMLGCGLQPNTSMHALEELIEPPYLFGPELTYQLVLNDSQVIEKMYRPHNFNGYKQRYDRIGQLMHNQRLKTGTILNASCHLLDAQALWDTALPVLQRHPFYFVDRID